eukprot:scaffold938_cov399-Prasinococcus_capsulatus_cf.AAC.11
MALAIDVEDSQQDIDPNSGALSREQDRGRGGQLLTPRSTSSLMTPHRGSRGSAMVPCTSENGLQGTPPIELHHRTNYCLQSHNPNPRRTEARGSTSRLSCPGTRTLYKEALLHHLHLFLRP